MITDDININEATQQAGHMEEEEDSEQKHSNTILE